ncbi:MAG: hypothetical protein QGG26_08005 [Candidatus Undinarchaeales archaeon]|nr:hypothetical protein [Candidatus Undinarchaeales archaeon]
MSGHLMRRNLTLGDGGQFSLEFLLALSVGVVILGFAAFLNTYNWRNTRTNLDIRATESFVDTVAARVFEAKAMGSNASVLSIPMRAPVAGIRITKRETNDPDMTVLRFLIEDQERFPSGAFIDKTLLLNPDLVLPDNTTLFNQNDIILVWSDRQGRIRVGDSR